MTISNGMPSTGVVIRDCGPRDGLQPLAPMAVSGRIALVEALFAAGVADVEVGAFVSPRAVPAMVGTDEVVTAIPQTAQRRRWVLVPNERGAQMAVDAGVGHLTVTVSASPVYSEKNVGMTVDGSIAEVVRIRNAAPDAVVDAVVSCSFGSPFDDHVTVTDVADVCAAVHAAGVDQLTLADTTGMATPRTVADVLAAVTAVVPTGPGLHLHDTRGTALVNAWTALTLGVRRFDTSLGGLGGSPFAPNAGGNLATEDLVLVLNDAGFATGIDLDGLLDAGTMLSNLISAPLPSRVAGAGGIRPIA
jgi:hydroxymethylglutaryl-CoA lyase